MKPKYITWEKRDHILQCLYYKQFPPPNVLPSVIEEMGSLEEQRKNGSINNHKYQKIQTWKKVCGKFELDGGCLQCPHLRTKSNHPIFGEQLQPIPRLLSKLKDFPKD